jgi:hypothetical protein
MSQAVIDYREDPLAEKSKSKHQKSLDCKMLNLKNAYIAEKLSLLDYLYALASNIQWTMYVDDEDTVSYIESSIIESSSEDEETEVEINYDDLDVQPEPLDRDLAEQSMFIAANKSITKNINSSLMKHGCKLIFKFFIFFYNFFER